MRFSALHLSKSFQLKSKLGKLQSYLGLALSRAVQKFRGVFPGDLSTI